MSLFLFPFRSYFLFFLCLAFFLDPSLLKPARIITERITTILHRRRDEKFPIAIVPPVMTRAM